MSSIPNSAMPHAGAKPANDEGANASEPAGRFGQIADKVKEHPRAAAAAGAAVAVGIVAAAAIPALRARQRSAGPGRKAGARASKSRS